jgi:hypothetical protein
VSRAPASIIRFDGKRVASALYDGSMDTLSPNMSTAPDEAWEIAKGRAQRPDGMNVWDVMEACTHELEVGYAYTTYGNGFYWPVRYCRVCMVVHGPIAPWWILEGSDAPESWLDVWPKRGTPPIEVDAADVLRQL